MKYAIKRIEKIDEKIIVAINELMQQLLHNNYPVRLTGSRLKKVAQQRNVWIYGAFVEEKLVGSATLYLVDTIVRKLTVVEEVVVHQGYRRQGIASALMDTLIKKSLELKADCIELNVEEDNTVAQNLYFNKKFEDRKEDALRLWINEELRF